MFLVERRMSRSGNYFALSTIGKIVAIKECAGLDAITELIERAPKDFLVYWRRRVGFLPPRHLADKGLFR